MVGCVEIVALLAAPDVFWRHIAGEKHVVAGPAPCREARPRLPGTRPPARAVAERGRGRDRGAARITVARRRGIDPRRFFPPAAAALVGRRRTPPSDLCASARRDRQGRTLGSLVPRSKFR